MLLAPGIESCDLGFLDLMNPVNVNSSLNQGLVSRWQVVPGLEGTNFWYDLCGRNKGTLTNGPTWDGATGRQGGSGSVRFDGSNDRVQLASASYSGAQGSVSAWVRPSGVTSGTLAAFFGVGGSGTGQWILSLRPSGSLYRLEFYQKSDAAGTTNFLINAGNYTYPDGAWIHLTVTANGSAWNLYENGKIQPGAWIVVTGSNAGTWIGSTTIASAVATVGSTYVSGSYLYPFKGVLDDVRVWERALSSGEAKAVYEDSRAGSPQTLNWISPYYVPRQLTAQEPVPGDVYGLFGGGDFTGIQMGVPPEAIAAVGGYQGLLDFIGIPYGLPSQITPSAGNQAAARRRFYRHVVMHQTYRSILDHSRMTEVAHLALVNRIANQWNEYQAQLARSREIAIFATLLSEV